MSLPAAIAAMIGEFNELYPGQPASPEVLKSMLKKIIEQSEDENCPNVVIGSPSSAYFWLYVESGEDNHKRMFLEFKGPSRPGGPPTLDMKDYDASEEGLLQAIVDGKELLKRYHRDGVCEECKNDFRERVKLEGGTHCLQCTMNKALGV